MKNGTVKKITENIIKIIFGIIVISLFVCSMFSTADVEKNEHTVYINDNPLIHIGIITAVCVTGAFLKYKVRNIKLKNKWFIIVCICLWVVACIGWIFITKLQPRADQKHLMQTAIQMKEGNFASFEKGRVYV